MSRAKKYGQFCPVAQAAEVVAEPWMPLVLRELLCGSTRFNELRRGVPRMSPSLLSKRLTELERAGIVRREEGQGQAVHYRLTAAGSELRPVIEALGVWGKRWMPTELDEDDLDATLLMWDLQRRVVHDELPQEQTVIHFYFSDAEEGARRFWLVLEGETADLCLKDPGHEVDLRIEADLGTFTAVWLGDLSWSDALTAGGLEVVGPTHLRRALPEWLGLSLFAAVDRRA